MSSVVRILNILTRMADLAKSASNPDIIPGELERAARRVEDDAEEGARTIRAMYGGMGSLNDFVLFRDSQPLVDENTEFDSLRAELFRLCLELTSYRHAVSPKDI